MRWLMAMGLLATVLLAGCDEPPTAFRSYTATDNKNEAFIATCPAFMDKTKVILTYNRQHGHGYEVVCEKRRN